MRVPRIYQASNLSPFSKIMLDPQAALHVLTVLRLKKGHKLILFNGDNQEYPAEIIYIHRQKVEVQLKESILKNFESPLNLHLGQVITKGEKMDYLLQKATELGVTRITPLFSTRGEVRLKDERAEKKREHWLRILQSACEQCGRNTIPHLEPFCKLPEWVSARSEPFKCLLDHRAEESLTTCPIQNPICILIGPEGGLTFEEKIMAERFGFKSFHLGPRILRSETAGIAAITLLQARIGDLAVHSPYPQSMPDSE